MKNLLVDTHLLLWALDEPERLPQPLLLQLEDRANGLAFSVVSLWEIAIKAGLRRADFSADARAVRATLIRDGWRELDFNGEHAIIAGGLPRLHGDPFDRALVGQAQVERHELITGDTTLAAYGSFVRVV